MPAMKTPRKMVRIPKPMRLAQRKRFFVGPVLSSDEAVVSPFDEWDACAACDERREGRCSCPDALDSPGPTMSFQLFCPLLVATCSPFQRIVLLIG